MQNAMCRMMTLSQLRIARVRDARAWLATLVRREALMLLRTNRRRIQRERQRESTSSETLGAIGTPVSHDDLTRAVDALPRRLREVVVLKHVAGLTFDQIAIATGLNRNTAAGIHRRAIQQLQTMIGAAEPPAVIKKGSEGHG